MGKAQSDSDLKSEALGVLDRARGQRESAEVAERDAVVAARAAGVSWARIGELYGLTKQGAQQRFKPGVKKALEAAVEG